MEGFRFVNQTAPIRALLLLLGLVSLVGMPYVVLMPIFADQILHGGARGLGILMGATGVGALLGALTLAFRQGVKGLGRWVAWCCAGFGGSLVVFSLSHSVLDFGDSAAARGLHDHAADGVLEHLDTGDGAGCAARAGDGGVFDDVHGHGADWGAAGRRAGRAPGRSAHGRNRGIGIDCGGSAGLACNCLRFAWKRGG